MSSRCLNCFKDSTSLPILHLYDQVSQIVMKCLVTNMVTYSSSFSKIYPSSSLKRHTSSCSVPIPFQKAFYTALLLTLWIALLISVSLASGSSLQVARRDSRRASLGTSPYKSSSVVSNQLPRRPIINSSFEAYRRMAGRITFGIFSTTAVKFSRMKQTQQWLVSVTHRESSLMKSFSQIERRASSSIAKISFDSSGIYSLKFRCNTLNSSSCESCLMVSSLFFGISNSF